MRHSYNLQVSWIQNIARERKKNLTQFMFSSRFLKTFVPRLSKSKHTLPDLPYDYNALEPFISAEIMQLHHQKHHQAYVTNLNVFEEKLDAAMSKKDITSQISMQGALKFNGGGHIKFELTYITLVIPFFGRILNLQEMVEVNCARVLFLVNARGNLADLINRDFGSLEQFKSIFATQAAGVQGSGWGWLGYNNSTKRLEIATTANQDPLLHLTPLLGVDGI